MLELIIALFEWSLFIWPRDTMSVGKANKKRCVYAGPSMLCSDVMMYWPVAQLYWSSLLTPYTGEVHPGRAGKPGAGQKIFRSGFEAEQSKHAGIIWSIYGKCCLGESEKLGENVKPKTVQPLLKLWFVKASARHWVCQTRLHLCGVGKGLPDRSVCCWLRWWTPELEKFSPGVLYASNNTSLVSCSGVYDLHQ